MSEYKTADDMIPKALYLIKHLVNEKLDIRLGDNNKLFIDYTRDDVKWLASEILDVYTQGVHEWLSK